MGQPPGYASLLPPAFGPRDGKESLILPSSAGHALRVHLRIDRAFVNVWRV